MTAIQHDGLGTTALPSSCGHCRSPGLAVRANRRIADASQGGLFRAKSARADLSGLDRAGEFADEAAVAECFDGLVLGRLHCGDME